MNAREERFCEEYMVDLCPKAAAIRAGYKEQTAREACEWIRPENPTKPYLRARIDEMRAAQSTRTGITADRVLRELAAVAFADASGLVEQAGEPPYTRARLDRATDPESARAIQSIRVTPEGGVEIRMSDKNKALELLGKHLGLFADNVRLDVALPQIVDDI